MQVSIKPASQLESEDAQYRSRRTFGRKGSSRLGQWVRQDVEQPPLHQGEIQDHLLEWQPSSDLRIKRRNLQQQWAPAGNLEWDPPAQQGAGQGRSQHPREPPASGSQAQGGGPQGQAQAAQDDWGGQAQSQSAAHGPRDRQGAGLQAAGPSTPLPLFEVDPSGLR